MYVISSFLEVIVISLLITTLYLSFLIIPQTIRSLFWRVPVLHKFDDRVYTIAIKLLSHQVKFTFRTLFSVPKVYKAGINLYFKHFCVYRLIAN